MQRLVKNLMHKVHLKEAEGGQARVLRAFTEMERDPALLTGLITSAQFEAAVDGLHLCNVRDPDFQELMREYMDPASGKVKYMDFVERVCPGACSLTEGRSRTIGGANLDRIERRNEFFKLAIEIDQRRSGYPSRFKTLYEACRSQDPECAGVITLKQLSTAIKSYGAVIQLPQLHEMVADFFLDGTSKFHFSTAGKKLVNYENMLRALYPRGEREWVTKVPPAVGPEGHRLPSYERDENTTAQALKVFQEKIEAKNRLPRGVGGTPGLDRRAFERAIEASVLSEGLAANREKEYIGLATETELIQAIQGLGLDLKDPRLLRSLADEARRARSNHINVHRFLDLVFGPSDEPRPRLNAGTPAVTQRLGVTQRPPTPSEIARKDESSVPATTLGSLERRRARFMNPGPPGLFETLPGVGPVNRETDPFEQRKLKLLSMDGEKPTVTYKGQKMTAEEMTLQMADHRRMQGDDYARALQAIAHMEPDSLIAIQRKLEKFHRERDVHGQGGMATGVQDPLGSTIFSNLRSTTGFTNGSSPNRDSPNPFFASADTNRDGTLSPSELRHALARRNVHITNQELFGIMAMYDKNGDGMISFDEYMNAMQEDGVEGFGSTQRPTSKVEERPRLIVSATLRQDQLGKRGHDTTLGKQRSLVQEKLRQRFSDAAGVRKFRAAMRAVAADSVDPSAQAHTYGSRMPFKLNLHSFELALRMLNLQLDKSALKVLFDSYDFDKNGSLDVDEFLASVTQP